MTDKEKILKAINQKQQEIWPTDTGEMKPATVPFAVVQGWLNALKWMEDLINSLPAEQPRHYAHNPHPMKQKAMIGWLKKQNAPASDIPKTKFKAGDWAMTDYGNVVYIESISETKYLLQCIDGHHEKMSFEYVDTCWRPWTVQDAKDGDVLATKDAVFIFKHMDKAGLSLCKSYCEVIGDSKLGLGLDFSVDSVHPATKEECDILFQKIKEAGYGWDSDKKELKVESKFSWSEEDENTFVSLCSKLPFMVYDCYLEDVTKYIFWLKTLKQRLDGTK